MAKILDEIDTMEKGNSTATETLEKVRNIVEKAKIFRPSCLNFFCKRDSSVSEFYNTLATELNTKNQENKPANYGLDPDPMDTIPGEDNVRRGR